MLHKITHTSISDGVFRIPGNLMNGGTVSLLIVASDIELKNRGVL